MPKVVLKTQNLTKRYGDLTAVEDLNLEIYEGEIFGFLGPNGAGKTTSIKMMCGLLAPDAGQVFIHGERIAEADEKVRARVGVCPQEIVLWERLTCLEQLQFIGQMYGLSRQVGRERGDALLAELDLTAKRDKLARTLSGGMQRRLNLAMALVHDPDILVLDEPEAGLDPQSRVKVREYIQSLARLKTVILTTHNMDEADRVADRVAIIDHGRLLVVDTPEALKGQVGEGDMIEIKVENLDALDSTRLEKRISNQVRDAVVDSSRQLLRVRALNAVRVLPVILDILEEGGAQASDVRIRENSLEDVFIQLTGRRLRS